MHTIKDIAMWIFIASSGLGLFYLLISQWPKFWAEFKDPFPRPAFAQVAVDGLEIPTAETQLVPTQAAPQPVWPPRRRRSTISNEPPRSRRPWIIGAASLVCVLAIMGLVVVTVSPSAYTSIPLTEAKSGYLYVSPGHQVIYLQVQGALTSTTGTWLEADRTAKGVVRHEWSFAYSCDTTTVHIVLSTPTGAVVLTGAIDNAQYSAMDVLLPVDDLGLFPPPAHFVAASPADWNSAYSALVAGT